MSNKPKPIPAGAKNSSGNDESKVVFSIVIEALNNGTSRHKINMNPVFLEPCRDLLFTHMTLIQEQITITKMKKELSKVKIVGPEQMPPGMKLHS